MLMDVSCGSIQELRRICHELGTLADNVSNSGSTTGTRLCSEPRPDGRCGAPNKTAVLPHEKPSLW